MTKNDLVLAVAKKTNFTKKIAENAVTAVLDSIKEALQKGEKVTLVGFGNFYTVKRKARKGKNPKTGKTIKIPAKVVPKFSVSKALKKLVADKNKCMKG